MQLNWFTVIAQIVNFLILVLLLKHVLYSRIIQVMDDRERHIAAQLEKAEHQQQEAEQEAQHYQEQQAELAESKQQMLDEARQNARDERKRLLNEARQDVDDQKSAWQAALAKEQEEVLRALREQTQWHVHAMAANVLRELADADLETQTAQNFVQRLHALDDDVRQSLFGGEDSQQELTCEIRSAFELPEELQGQMTESVAQLSERQPAVQFSTVPEMMGGIELHARGMKIGWTMTERLDALERAWNDELDQSHAA